MLHERSLMSVSGSIQNGMIRCFAVASGIMSVVFGSAAAKDSGSEARETPAAVAAPACEGCPEFVAVPAPPDSLRAIVAVAKYELTWNEYLAAVDDGACTVQNPSRPPFFRSRPDEINPHLEWFRIDWPITILDPVDVHCYLDWLSDRIGVPAVIPTKQEWRWFASAGRSDWRYPWGNDPGAGHEMLANTIDDRVVRLPWPGQREARYVDPYLVAFKVGQGEPNPWGLHDLLGNALELTTTIMPPRGECLSVALAGVSYSDPDWAEEGLDANFSSFICEGQYSAAPAVRLVLIGENAGE
ncbi:formylglycine-generating enzyme family protein [Aurantiacibacter flavus]|uniref:SUMF1/EgtB/PvdO family nonheme iron enzyme n=1 Tax=Aurantiacibacter flavus TaxID=3145232 RepID=A0ABV0CSQ5_9SPHN